MTRKEREKVEKHFDELHAIATGITLPDDIRQALKAAYMAGADYAIDVFAPRWISVEDELPKGVINDNVTKMVLTFSADGYIRLDRYMHYYHRWVNGASEVTHWMPTPQPPSSSEKPNNFKKGGEQ